MTRSKVRMTGMYRYFVSQVYRKSTFKLCFEVEVSGNVALQIKMLITANRMYDTYSAITLLSKPTRAIDRELYPAPRALDKKSTNLVSSFFIFIYLIRPSSSFHANSPFCKTIVSALSFLLTSFLFYVHPSGYLL